MTVGYIIAGGADLDAVFAARVSAPTSATGFKSSGGTDLNQRFEPRGATTARANTGFKIAGGTDLAQVFKALGGDTITLADRSVFASGAGTQTAAYDLQSVGDIRTLINGAATDVGDWIVPKTSAPGSYECRATLLAGLISNGTLNTWLAISTSPGWQVFQPVVGSSSATIRVEIRLGTTVFGSCTVTLQAQRTV